MVDLVNQSLLCHFQDNTLRSLVYEIKSMVIFRVVN
jgi:hypothetical protein